MKAVGKLALFFTVSVVFFLSVHSASARDLWTSQDDGNSDESTLKLNSALKTTGLGSAPSTDPEFSSDGVSGAALLRLRLEPSFETGPQANSWKLDAAYDNELEYGAGSPLAASYALPNVAAVPFRIWPISYTGISTNLTDTQQLDRAFVSYKAKSFDATLGRQAVGWGRGTLFSAVDIFAPFTPLQIDQEWRSGVDALSADYKITDTTSIQGVAAGGATLNQSAFGAKIRGFLGPVDAELMVATRAQDTMYGLTSSAAISDAEVHGEFALFQTPGDTPSNGIFGNPSLIPKAVLGVSNNFQLGNGLKVTLEYHYSGFGATNPAGLSPLLSNPAFEARLAQGDTQILGDQALGLNATYTLNQSWSGSLTFLQSLIDTSGVIAPSADWDFSDSASLLATVFFAYGASSLGGVLQSQYGAIPPTIILQLRIYD